MGSIQEKPVVTSHGFELSQHDATLCTNFCYARGVPDSYMYRLKSQTPPLSKYIQIPATAHQALLEAKGAREILTLGTGNHAKKCGCAQPPSHLGAYTAYLTTFSRYLTVKALIPKSYNTTDLTDISNARPLLERPVARVGPLDSCRFHDPSSRSSVGNDLRR